MRLCYVLLSPTRGMHQYTSDLAARRCAQGDEVHLVTTSLVVSDRYGPQVQVHTPVALTNTGFSAEGALHLRALPRVAHGIVALDPDLVHLTGPHLWNPLLVDRLHSAGIRVVHTLHDLHPHTGARYGRLLYVWNDSIKRRADHLLVHGRCFRDELVEQGLVASRVTCTLLTHSFLSYGSARVLEEGLPSIEYEPWALFFGRRERYKGLDVLIEAALQAGVHVCIAGQGSLHTATTRLQQPLPDNIESRDHLVGDSEAIDLFRRCGVVVLPYVEASQSALVAAAYFWHKPVIVTRTGALPEYVVEGETGWVVPSGDASALASALKEALSSPARLSEMGRAGRAWWERQRLAEGQALDLMYRAAAGRHAS